MLYKLIFLSSFFWIERKAHATNQNIQGHRNIIIEGNHDKIHLHSSTSFVNKEIKLKFRPVRSELKVPDESILLQRPVLIKSLKEKLLQKTGIKTVTIAGVVGMGGVGKTTAARLWALEWEKKIHRHVYGKLMQKHSLH